MVVCMYTFIQCIWDTITTRLRHESTSITGVHITTLYTCICVHIQVYTGMMLAWGLNFNTLMEVHVVQCYHIMYLQKQHTCKPANFIIINNVHHSALVHFQIKHYRCACNQHYIFHILIKCRIFLPIVVIHLNKIINEKRLCYQ